MAAATLKQHHSMEAPVPGPESLALPPMGTMKNMNMMHNKPINLVNARVEKVNSVYGVYAGTWDSGTSADPAPVVASAEPGYGQQPAVVFHALPRAHDSALEVRQRTLERQQHKEAQLSSFMETTRARVTGKEKNPRSPFVLAKSKGTDGTEEQAPDGMDEKTRRRLTQSLSLLLPRANGGALSRSKRVRAWAGPMGGENSGKGGEEDTLLPPAEIAAGLGDAVLSGITDGQRARESLLSHRRTHTSDGSAPSSFRWSEAAPVAPVAPATADASKMDDSLDTSVNQSSMHEHRARLLPESSVACSLNASVWEGENVVKMKEKQNQLDIYKQLRRSLMMGERNRVRQLRESREAEEARERAEDALRQQREALRAQRLAEEEELERQRQMVQQVVCVRARACACVHHCPCVRLCMRIPVLHVTSFQCEQPALTPPFGIAPTGSNGSESRGRASAAGAGGGAADQEEGKGTIHGRPPGPDPR